MKKSRNHNLHHRSQKLDATTLAILQAKISETKNRVIHIGKILTTKGYHVLGVRVQNFGAGLLNVNFNPFVYEEAFPNLPKNFNVRALPNNTIQLFYETKALSDPEIIMALDKASEVLLKWSEQLSEISFFGIGFTLESEIDSNEFDQKFKGAYNFQVHKIGSSPKFSQKFLYSTALSFENMEKALSEIRAFADTYNAQVKAYAIKS
jgi:hypothetical protein